MKNKVILSFLIIPIIIACQNNNVNVSSSPSPSKSVVTSVSPTNTIVPTVTPTTNVVLSPSPSIITPTPSPTIDPDITPIIESNMIKVVPEIIRPTYPPEKITEWLRKFSSYPSVREAKIEDIGVVRGIVKDENDKPIVDAIVTLKNIQYKDSLMYGYDYIRTTRTDYRGIYKLNIPTLDLVSISVMKNGYTSRYEETPPNDDIFGGVKNDSSNFKLTKSPEIILIKINGNQVTNYRDLGREKLKLIFNPSNKVKSDANIPKFKMKNTDYLRIDINFNNSIKKESLEDNLYIESLDKSINYDKSTRDISFNWMENDTQLTIKMPINIKTENVIYRFGFKNPFVDFENNSVFNNEYITITSTNLIFTNEISENIIFEIAGSK